VTKYDFFLNLRWRTHATLKILSWTSSRLPDFSEILCREAVFHPRSTERVYCFPNAVRASASGGFGIVSDTPFY